MCTLFNSKQQLIEFKKNEILKKRNDFQKDLEILNKEICESSEEFDTLIAYRHYSEHNDLERRKELFLNNKNGDTTDLQSKIDKLNLELKTFDDGIKLSSLLNKNNIDHFFSSTCYENSLNEKNNFEEIKRSHYLDLLKYLIRNGLIDETYSDYMTYFYEGGLSRQGKIFLRSVSDEKAKPYSYKLDNPEEVASRLEKNDFKKVEVLNFDLLNYLLSLSRYETYLRLLITQLEKDDNSQFVLEYQSKCSNSPRFIEYLNELWPSFFTQLRRTNNLATIDQINMTANWLIEHSERLGLYAINENLQFSKYISSNISVLSARAIEKTETFVSHLETLEVKFQNIDKDTITLPVWTGIYTKNLYELNWNNIIQILKYVYKLAEENYNNNNLELIQSDSSSPLAKVVDSSINEYLDLYFEKCDGVITDSEATILYVLNNDSIPIEKKATYISLLQTQLPSLETIKNKALWSTALEHNIIVFSEHSALLYFLEKGRAIDEQLINYLNKHDEKVDFKSISSKFEQEDFEDFFNNLVQCMKLFDSSYKKILSSFNLDYPSFLFEGLSDSKISILIDLNIIQMNSKNLLFMRKNYPKHLLAYILNQPQTYINETVTKDNFDHSEAIEVLNSTADDKIKLSVLKLTKNTFSLQKISVSSKIEAEILKNHFDFNDFQWLSEQADTLSRSAQRLLENKIITNIFEFINRQCSLRWKLLQKILKNSDIKRLNQLEILALSIKHLDIHQTKDAFRLLNESDYLDLLDGKRPIFEGNDINEKLLTALKDNNFISQFKVEGDKLRGIAKSSLLGNKRKKSRKLAS